MPRIIAIAGLAGSGKSTVASMLVQQHGFKLVKFAEPIKDMLRAIGLTTDDLENPGRKGLPYKLLGNRSPRYAMQTLGTEWGRVLMGENLWTGIWKARVRQLLLDGSAVVCDDCRFANEVEVVKDFGGEIWAIRRRGTQLLGSHPSEAGVAMRHADWNVSNNGDLQELHLTIAERMSRG